MSAPAPGLWWTMRRESEESGSSRGSGPAAAQASWSGTRAAPVRSGAARRTDHRRTGRRARGRAVGQRVARHRLGTGRNGRARAGEDAVPGGGRPGLHPPVPVAAQHWADLREPDEVPMPVVEQPVEAVLAELAAAMRQTDMYWPRPDDEDYVELRALAWARCRRYLPDWPDAPDLPDEQRQE